VTTLLARDLRLLAPWVWAIVPAHALFTANGIGSPELFFWMHAALALAITGVLLTIEWRLDAERFVASLPVTRKDVVRARHVGALGTAVVATMLYALYGRATTALAPDRLHRIWGYRARGWESWEGCLAFLLVLALLSFAFLPLHFRLGFGRALAVFTAVAGPLALLAFVPALLGRHGGSGGAGPRPPAEALRAALAGLSDSLGPWATTAAVLAAVAGLGALSLHLSVRAYERRDL
jgi:hypothetical protein